MPRHTPRQDAVVSLVTRNPGCAILPVAQHIGPNGSIRYGYAAVHRAIKAGRIRAVKLGSRYQLFPV